MKKVVIILSLLGGTTYAQCPQLPVCTNTVQMSSLGNQSTNQSTCFVGNGVIPHNYNWNNWGYLSFSGTIGVDQNVNFPSGANKVYNHGNITYSGHVNWNGNDTMVLYQASVNVGQVTANNSGGNVIAMDASSQLFVGGVQYFPEDTIHTTPGNGSNDVYVIGCSGTPLGIISISLQSNNILWEAPGDVEVQYSENSKDFRTIYFTSQKRGKIELKEAGFYRIMSEGSYSTIVRLNLTELLLNNNIIYYNQGQFQLNRPSAPVVGEKQTKN